MAQQAQQAHQRDRTAHKRQPSINSASFAVEAGTQGEGHDDGDEEQVEEDEEQDDDVSTDSYGSQDGPVFDPVEYLHSALDGALASMEFNKSLALQAKLSGKLKNKEFELLTMQEEAHRRLRELQDVFRKGAKTVESVSRELKAGEKRAQQLTRHVEKGFPIEFNQAREKVMTRPVVSQDEDDDELYV